MANDGNIADYSLMGILNLTDNSFVKASRMALSSLDDILSRVDWMLQQGASYIDIGACSSAPGNELVDEETEWKRLQEPLKAIFSAFGKSGVKFSIDTFRSGIIERSLNLGCEIIANDIFASEADSRMLDVVAANNLEYIPMDHSADPYAFFTAWADTAERKGIRRWILDPGFGFGKSVERNWEVMEELPRFKDFGVPVLSATSRKRMIYMPLGLESASCAKESVEAELGAVAKGADIIRTHDLDLHRQFRKL